MDLNLPLVTPQDISQHHRFSKRVGHTSDRCRANPQRRGEIYDGSRGYRSRSSILIGKPVIRGTPLSVDFVIGPMANGWREADILCNYLGLSHDAEHRVALAVREESWRAGLPASSDTVLSRLPLLAATDVGAILAARIGDELIGPDTSR
jgi:hypothetical protein